MKMLLNAAQTLPLHVGRVGERAPPLCGAVPADSGHIARPGDAVAALVKVSEKEENWILAEVSITFEDRNKVASYYSNFKVFAHYPR